MKSKKIKKYINDVGLEVPENKILIFASPLDKEKEAQYLEILQPLKGNIKRDWFSSHFYYCLPLTIGNQYGFVIRSYYNFDAEWNGEMGPTGNVKITIKDYIEDGPQTIESYFGSGILTIQNNFYLKTPPGINLMTIQPPNMFIPGIAHMTGVVESDQIRRDFTFNIKFTDAHRKVSFKKGDPLGAFILIPRYFIENFEIDFASNYFNNEIINNESLDRDELYRQRDIENKNNLSFQESRRKYFNGEHAFGEPYSDHQKRIK
jgi:hypothetical protein